MEAPSLESVRINGSWKHPSPKTISWPPVASLKAARDRVAVEAREKAGGLLLSSRLSHELRMVCDQPLREEQSSRLSKQECTLP